MVGNEKKRALLGMPYGTAMGRLRKALIFRMASRLEMLGCYRCGIQIALLDDFSIEHKAAWASASDPVAAFFDLENIAFSHVVCNIGAATKSRIYPSEAERGHVNFAKYYAKPDKREQVLRRKRERWHRRPR